MIQHPFSGSITFLSPAIWNPEEEIPLKSRGFQEYMRINKRQLEYLDLLQPQQTCGSLKSQHTRISYCDNLELNILGVTGHNKLKSYKNKV